MCTGKELIPEERATAPFALSCEDDREPAKRDPPPGRLTAA